MWAWKLQESSGAKLLNLFGRPSSGNLDAMPTKASTDAAKTYHTEFCILMFKSRRKMLRGYTPEALSLTLSSPKPRSRPPEKPNETLRTL